MAMKEQDKPKLSILRQINQAIKQIEVDEKREVGEADIVSIIKKLQKITSEEIETNEKSQSQGNQDRLQMLKRQAQILNSLLPEQLEGEKLEELCQKGIDETGATSRRDTGKVMAFLTDATKGNFDKAAAAKFIGTKLS